MGLDGVEMIMELEERFGVELADDTLSGNCTVGDLQVLIESQLNARPSNESACINVLTFIRMRSFLKARGRFHHSRTKTTTLLPVLFPEATRARDWREVGRKTGLKLPRLVSTHPRLFGFGLLVVFVGTVLVFYGSIGLLSFLPAIIFTIFMYGWISRGFAQFPSDIKTFGDLIEATAIRSIGVFASEGSAISHVECWVGIVDIVSKFAARIPEGGILPEHRIIDDLFVGD